MATYPVIGNCNYESADSETERAVHAARLAVEAGYTEDETLVEALADLEATLITEAPEGEFRRGQVSREAIESAESAVAEAWTDDVQDAARAKRIAGYRD